MIANYNYEKTEKMNEYNGLVQTKAKLKRGNYKLFKLPNKSLFINNSDMMPTNQVILYGTPDYRNIYKSDSYMIDIFTLKDDEVIIFNCDNRKLFKDTISNVNNMYELNDGTSIIEGIAKYKINIDYAFGVNYYDKNGSDYIINGMPINIKNSLCNMVTDVKFVKNIFGKVIALLDNHTTYDLDRFKAEFDNRYLPKVVRYDEILEYSKDDKSNSYDKLIDSLFSIYIFNIKNTAAILNIIRMYISNSYSTSVLKYYNIPKPELDIRTGTLKYTFLSYDMLFKIKVNRQMLISLYYKNDAGKSELIIDNKNLTSFYKHIKQFFALYNKDNILELIPKHLSLVGAEILNDYKKSSGDYNKIINKISEKSEKRLSNIDIGQYINTLYLFNLISKCKINTEHILFRGKIKDNESIRFRSLSFALPVALYHGKTIKNVAIIKCNKGGAVLTNSTSEYSHEAELVLNADYTLHKQDNILIAKQEMINVKTFYTRVMILANKIIYDRLLSNYLYLYSADDEKLRLEGIHSELSINIEFLTNKSLAIVSYKDNQKVEFDIDAYDSMLCNIKSYVLYCVRNGMEIQKYRIVHKNIAMNTQSLLLSIGIIVSLSVHDGYIDIIVNKDNFIRIRNCPYISITNSNMEEIYSTRNKEIDTDSLAVNCAFYILNNYKVSYIKYIKYLTNYINELLNIEIKSSSNNKLQIKINNKYYNIYDGFKKIYIKNKLNKILAEVELTFNEVEDAKRLYKSLINIK